MRTLTKSQLKILERSKPRKPQPKPAAVVADKSSKVSEAQIQTTQLLTQLTISLIENTDVKIDALVAAIQQKPKTLTINRGSDGLIQTIQIG